MKSKYCSLHLVFDVFRFFVKEKAESEMKRFPDRKLRKIIELERQKMLKTEPETPQHRSLPQLQISNIAVNAQK